MKVETHNHPTAISPFAGAATGSGGEIRDEGATGRGGRPKAGLTGFSVSNLRLPSAPRPWERPAAKPERIASALDIMIEGPIGGAAFNNEFGRPGLCGYFRTFELEVDGPTVREVRGYHKPIMVAGGFGNVRAEQVEEGARSRPGTPIVVLGGPAMLIGLGGGAASSLASGASAEDLDFASVQRDNAEMQRRCQEVIDRCAALRRRQPDPVDSRRRRGRPLERAPRAGATTAGAARGSRCATSPAPSPGCRRWRSGATRRRSATCWRSRADRLPAFAALCARERCPHAVIGHATDDGQLVVEDALRQGRRPTRRPSTCRSSVLLGKPPRTTRQASARAPPRRRRSPPAPSISARRLRRVLRLPTVADKTFLITIGDRTVGGLVARDQMVGRWQVPVADAARDRHRVRRHDRRGDGDGRTHAGRAARRGGLGASGRGRGDHQHRVGADRDASPT